MIISANEADVLLGGCGRDLIIGGGGADTVYGDGSTVNGLIARNWTITRTVVTNSNGIVHQVVTTQGSISSNPKAGDDDSIYAGAGVDWIFAGGGNDFVDASDDADRVLDGAWRDTLHSVGGNDFANCDYAGVIYAGSQSS